MHKALLSLAATAALQLVTPAQAAITTTNYLITGSAGSGSFSLDFNEATSAYALSALDFFVGATFDTSNAGMDTFGSDLIIGGNYGGPFFQGANVNDFTFVFDPTAATQTIGPGFGYGFSLVGFPGTGSNELTITQIAAPPPGVPEPSTWAMMLLGFGAAGLAMRRRKRVMPRLSRTT